jgi:spermidine synthase
MVSSLIYPKKIKWITLSFIGMIIIYIFLFEPIRSLEHNINTYQWLFINDKLTFVRSIDTKYQNLSLLRLENQYTVYADGRPAYNIPNTYDAEVFTHSIMVHQPNAKRVLILGGGFNGVLKEILKYPVNEIEYIEIDPALLPFIEPVLDQQNRNALNNVKVKIVSGDGREFLSRKQRSFDVIILNIGEPSTASLNRFFTLEFYRQCASRLSYNGICAVSFPSSTEYIANELKDLDASIYHTFKRAFTNVLIVPGNRAIIIGSKGNQSLIFQPDSLARRYKNSGISSEYFSEYMYEDLLLPERVKFITETLESIQNYRLNTDNNPVTYYFDLMLWNRFLHGDNQFFSSVTRSRIFITGGVIAGLLLLLLICCRRQGIKRKKIVLAIIIACSGLVGMALNLLLLLNFQETFGSVYEMVGAMIAANMLGMALGALAAAWLVKYCQWKPVLLVVLLVFTAAVLFIPIVLNILLLIHILPLTLSITMLSGGLVGMLFGIVNRFYLDNSANVGSIYAFDVTGSSIGALTTCSLLLPVLGIHETTYLLAMIVFLAIVATITTNRIA